MPELPAIALIEYSSIALGTRALDSLLKKATVTLLRAGTVQPGKFAILFAGQVGAAEESYAAVLGKRGNWTNDTLGIIETPTMAAVLDAADAAVKGASVEIVELRLGDGLGGKGLAHFVGLQADMEAAIAIGSQRLAPRGQPICTAIIPRADETMLSTRGKSTRFGEGW